MALVQAWLSTLKKHGWSPAKRQLLGLSGFLLLPLFPHRSARIANEQFTLVELHRHRRDIIDHLLRMGLAWRAGQRRDWQTLTRYHRAYWRGTEAHLYHRSRNRFQTLFLPHFAYLVEELKAALADGNYTTLCEIGTGNGDLLVYLAQELPSIKHFVGIDLSEQTIADNQERYTLDAVEFVAADATAWIESHGQPHTIFLTFGGVFEYFAPAELEQLLDHIATTLSPTLILLVEPVAADHDLTHETESRLYGIEYAFSHNYPHLLQKHGFTILHQSEKIVFQDTEMVIIAGC